MVIVESACVSALAVIAVTVVAFALSVLALNTGVQKQSSRPRSGWMAAHVRLPQGASLRHEAQAKKIENVVCSPIREMNKSVRNFVSYINGSSASTCRWTSNLFNDNFAQLVAVTKDLAAREDLSVGWRVIYSTESGDDRKGRSAKRQGACVAP